LSGVEAMIGAN